MGALKMNQNKFRARPLNSELKLSKPFTHHFEHYYKLLSFKYTVVNYLNLKSENQFLSRDSFSD